MSGIEPLAIEAAEAVVGAAKNLVEPKNPPVELGFTWAAAGIWTALIGFAIRQVVLQAPGWWDRITGRNDKLRGERALAKLTDHQRLVLIEERLTRMATTVGGLMNAIVIGIDGLESDDVNERAKSADRMRMHVDLAIASLGKDDPFFDALTRMGAEVAGSAADMRPRGAGPTA